MNIITLMTILTFVTVIATYFSALRIFEFNFIKRMWYKVTEKFLWTLSVAIWIADIIVLKNTFTSELTVGAQFIIQLGYNSLVFAVPISVFAMYIIIRQLIFNKTEKVQY